MVIRAPYGGGVHGALYHSQSVEAIFANQPGLKIVMPSTPYDVKRPLKSQWHEIQILYCSLNKTCLPSH
ncbi:hypothetical protein ACEQPO_18545 [Bacillus sp. SL00103]